MMMLVPLTHSFEFILEIIQKKLKSQYTQKHYFSILYHCKHLNVQYLKNGYGTKTNRKLTDINTSANEINTRERNLFI